MINLNSEQQQAVCKPFDINLRIIAGPGTGKTTVLTNRYLHFLAQKWLNPTQILVLTFTRKAANSLKERIQTKLPYRNSQLLVFTYHAFCLWLLQRETAQDWKIIDQTDQKNLIQKLFQNLKNEIQDFELDKEGTRQILLWIRSIQTNLVTNYQEYQKLLTNVDLEFPIDVDYQRMLWKLYNLYTQYKKTHNFLDFDDLLAKTYQLLQSNPNLLNKWRRRFRHVFIDEFQDTSVLQYRLIGLLTNFGKNIFLTVVGDPDQTIYSWRNAQIKFILELDKHFDNVQTVYLNQNYRSNPKIITAVNHLISYNKNRLPKQLKFAAFEHKPQRIQINTFSNRQQQAEAIVAEIVNLQKTGVKLAEIAILYRANWLSLFLETELLNHKIRYIVYKGIQFFLLIEIKQLFHLVALLVTEDDFYAMTVLEWLHKMGPKTVQKIQELATNQQQRIMEFLLNNDNLGKLSFFNSELVAFVKMFQNWKVNSKTIKGITQLFELIVNDFSYPRLKKLPDFEKREKNIVSLLEMVKRFDENHQKLKPFKRLEKFLNDTKIYLINDFDKPQNAVQLMTIHNTKGLEFDHVFIFEVTENVFPSRRTEDWEEERRLFFVGLTRARKSLFITGDFINESLFVEEMLELDDEIIQT